MLKLLFKFSFKLFLLISLVISFLLLGNVFTYSRLAEEEPIAQLTFANIKNQEFIATIRLGDFCKNRSYTIYGDEFRIDARFLKWKSWATLFGADPLYRVERLSGRYTDISDENLKPGYAYALNPITTYDISELFERYKSNLTFVDTYYGSSAYEVMKPDFIYTVFRTQSGILIRTTGPETKTELLKCSEKPSVLKTSFIKMDQGLASLIKPLNF